MFQNISEDTLEDDEIRENRINLLFKEMFRPRNCIIYILTFLLSMVEIKAEVFPFGLAIVAACLGGTIPVFMVYIVSLISVAIFHSGIGFLNYFYTSLIFFLLIFVFKPKISTDDRNEVFKVGTRLFFAIFIYTIIKNIRGTFAISDVFFGFIIGLITYTFYKIFVNGIVVMRDYSIKDAFTVEEIIAAAIIISIAISAFKNVTIAGYSISYVLITLLIIYIGFKNGIAFGGITGLAIGASLTLIADVQLFQIGIFIVGGILAGILAHIVMPNKFKKKVFNSETLLGDVGEHRLSYYEEIKEKINAVAQTISDMNQNFFIKNSEEDEKLNKEVYIDNFLNGLENYAGNIFYDDIVRNESLVGDFFEELAKDDVITEKEMVEIFKKYNNYILLRDQKLKDDLQEIIKIANRTYKELQINSVKVKIKKEEAKKLENELNNVTKIRKDIPKDENELKKFEKKEKEIFTLLKGKLYPIRNVNVEMCDNGKYIVGLKFEYKDELVEEKSKIANIESLISKSLNTNCTFQKDKRITDTNDYIQVYASTDKFKLSCGSNKISKDGSGKVSGDSNLQVRLNDGKYLLAISDGMGSGEKARKASKFVVENLSNLMSKGFKRDETIGLINSELNFNKDDEMYASLDMSILDLYSGKILMSKNGACNTYIKSKQGIKIYKGKGLPVGIVQDAGLDVQETELFDGDIILMCSDGLLDASKNANSDWIEDFLNNVNTANVQKIADLITTEAIDNAYGKPKDDITVIVAKIIKKR